VARFANGTLLQRVVSVLHTSELQISVLILQKDLFFPNVLREFARPVKMAFGSI
jgi:hypothetical protein